MLKARVVDPSTFGADELLGHADIGATPASRILSGLCRPTRACHSDLLRLCGQTYQRHWAAGGRTRSTASCCGHSTTQTLPRNTPNKLFG